MRYFFWGIFLLVLSCSSPPKRPSTDTREDVKPEVFSRQKRQVVPPQQVAAFIVDELFDKNPNIQGKRIGVLSFSDATGKLSAAGTLLSEKVISELTSRKSGTVVERKNLKRILEEQKLNMSGVTTDSGQEAGTVLGVDVLLSGSITPLAGKNQITAKVTDVKTGEIYSAVGLTTQGDGFGKKGGKVGKGLVAGSSGSDEIFREEFERLKVRNPPGYKKIQRILKRLDKVKTNDPETFMLITAPPGSQKIIRLQRENLPRFIKVRRIRKKVFGAIKHLPSLQRKLFLERQRVSQKLSQKGGKNF